MPIVQSIFLFILILVMSPTALAQSQLHSPSGVDWLELTFENDVLSLINNADNGYTNGIGIYWGTNYVNSYASLELPRWLAWLSKNTYVNRGEQGLYSIQYGIYQKMYTPADLSETALIEDDRPYAGTLIWHAKINQFMDNQANNLSLELGIAGPASQAEQAQTLIHKLTDSSPPMGWDNQISNELVFRLMGEHVSRFYKHDFNTTLGFDMSSYSIIGVGNLRSDIGTGLNLRIGELLDQSYANINPYSSKILHGVKAKGFHWQLFTSLFASYVFNDISLNGNTFKDSHSVKLNHQQMLFSGGLITTYNQWALTLSVHKTNDQFEGQDYLNKFGSISLSYTF